MKVAQPEAVGLDLKQVSTRQPAAPGKSQIVDATVAVSDGAPDRARYYGNEGSGGIDLLQLRGVLAVSAEVKTGRDHDGAIYQIVPWPEVHARIVGVAAGVHGERISDRRLDRRQRIALAGRIGAPGEVCVTDINPGQFADRVSRRERAGDRAAGQRQRGGQLEIHVVFCGCLGRRGRIVRQLERARHGPTGQRQIGGATLRRR